MQTKNLLAYRYNSNYGINIMGKIDLIKIVVPLALLIISLGVIMNLSKTFGYAKNRDILVADFKTDINMISETANVLEIERKSNKNLEISEFGSDGKAININEITPDLSDALVKIADINNDKSISNEEISDLGIMKLKSDVFQKELRIFQFNLTSVDRNLNNYIVLTKGKNAGTVLYNGSMKFIDNENRRYFGLELFT